MPADRVAPDLDPEAAGPQPRRAPRTGSTTPSSIPGSWRSPGPSTASRTTGSRPRTIGDLYDRADRARDGAAWDREVWDKTRLEAVFLTNDFDDPLEGWDTPKYVPCLRTDDLVLKLHEPATVERLRPVDGRGRAGLRDAPAGDRRRCSSGSSAQGARACAISLPPDFAPQPATPEAGGDADPAGPAPDGPPARRARRDPPRRLLDARRVLRRVPAAVRPDDRPDPQRLPGRRGRGPRPVRPPGQPARLPRAVQPLRRA